MQKTKIQHYVPRLYLKNFSIRKVDKFFINCYNKTNSTKFTTNIRNIAAENYFYDTDHDAEQEVEKILGEFEGSCNISYEKLLQTEDLNSLSQEEKIAIAYFLAVQLVRTKEYREGYKHNINGLYELLSKENMTKELRQQFEEAIQEKAIKSNHIQMLIEFPPQLASILMKKKWCLIENKTTLPNWTSDHPITMYNPRNFGSMGNLGLDVPGIQIFFPLNPRLYLAIVDPVDYAHHEDKIISTDIENSKFHNHQQLARCNKHIFSLDEDFSLADQLLKERPYLRNIDIRRGKWKFLNPGDKI